MRPPLDLGVDADGGLGRELHGVEHRLARGGEQGLRLLVERPVADGDDVDGHAVRVLELRHRGLERRGERRAAVERAAPLLSHERSSRSCRRASVATSRGSSARFCISASVWSTESCRCAAISARSWERIRSSRSSSSPRTSRSHHGARMSAERDDDDGHREDDVLGGDERVVEPEEDEAGADHERRAERDQAQRRPREPELPPRPAGAAAGPRLGLGRRLDHLRALRLAPDQRRAAAGEQHGPDERVAEPDPPRAEQQQDGEREEHDAAHHLPCLPLRGHLRGMLRPLARRAREPGGQEDPADDGERDAGGSSPSRARAHRPGRA